MVGVNAERVDAQGTDMSKHCRNCRNNIPNMGGCRCRCHPPETDRGPTVGEVLGDAQRFREEMEMDAR